MPLMASRFVLLAELLALGTSVQIHPMQAPAPAASGNLTKPRSRRTGTAPLTPAPTAPDEAPVAQGRAKEAVAQGQPNQPVQDLGIACACLEQTCFKTYDRDNDGCLSMFECKLQKTLGAKCNTTSWNPDKDDCINGTTEWPKIFAATNGSVCPVPNMSNMTVPPPDCKAGFYLSGTNPATCERCSNGNTRRRRSMECSSCAPLVDKGDYDDCVDPTICTCTGGDAIDSGCKCPCDAFSVGDEVSSYGLPVDPTCKPSANVTCEEFSVSTVVTSVTPDPKSDKKCLIGTNGSDKNCTAVYGANSPQCTNRPLIQTCTTKDGTEASRKYSGVELPVCACGAAKCSNKQKCWIGGGPKGEDVCLESGPEPVIPTPAPTVGARGDPHLVNLQGEHFDINHAGDFLLLRLPQNSEKTAEFSMLANIQPEFGKPCTTYITSLELSGDWLGGKSVQIRSFRRSHSNETGDDFLGARVTAEDIEAPWQTIEDFDDDQVLSEKGARVKVTLSKSQWFPKKRAAAKWAPTVAGMFTLYLQDKKNSEASKLIIRQDLPDQEHLNVAMRRLSALGRVDVGGLLGFDAHPEMLEQVSAQCRHLKSVTQSAVASQEDSPYYFKPAWKDQWEDKLQHRYKDNEAVTATLVSSKASEAQSEKMCKCSLSDYYEGLFADEGVLVEAEDANFLMASATW